MMIRIYARCLIILLLASSCFSAAGLSHTRHLSHSILESSDARIERLAGLAKLWGTIKYFHPYLAYKDIDWDAALVATIPKVNGAHSPVEYRGAINHLLSFLHDPATQVKIESNDTLESRPPALTKAADKATPPEFIRVVNGVTIITLMPVAQLMTADRAKAFELIGKLPAALKQAKAVVLDCRGAKTGNEEMDEYLSFTFTDLLRNTLTQIAEGPVPLGSIRYRIHSGYATQTGSTSGGYYSGLNNSAPETLSGQRAKGSRLPLAILINEATGSTDVLSGFQKAGLATIVQEGADGSVSGPTSYSMKLPDGLSVRIRTSEFINPDGQIGFTPDLTIADTNRPADAALTAAIAATAQPPSTKTVSAAQAPAVMRSIKDKSYPEMKFPSPEYRLLALFRFWNVIDLFYPYKHLFDEPWENVLTRFIPQFEANTNQIDYQRTVREMVAQIKDTHGFIAGVNEFDQSLGTFYPPLSLGYVEGQAVITRLLDEAAAKAVGLNVGDVILTIDGDPIQKGIERTGRLYAVSTPQAQQFRAMWMILAGAQASKAKLNVRSADGKTREVEIERETPLAEYRRAVFDKTRRKTPVYEVLPSGFGYIDLARLQYADADKAMDAMMKTPALIFDMRGYPNGTGWKIAPRLTSKKNVIGAQFRRPMLEAINLGTSDYSAGANFMFEQPLPPSTGEAYKGKVVIVINAEAISQAEHTCLFIEAATPVTFIGSPTNGANGDVTTMVLPGNIQVNFSGHDVRHADGRQLQRLGIQPHLKVEPTLRGIREGRDEQLEAAIKFLQENASK